ncbi:hypothetical protein V8J88_03810 [Massilia sp. W12]|uniref:hypothetical protein n=1 Tax=Massilia sp. W12 TaxID=3126507 RepID=UPI0030D173D4
MTASNWINGGKMAWYRTGLVSCVINDKTVRGTGTAWTLMVRAGYAFQGPDGALYEVAQVISDGQLQLSSAYKGATIAAGEYSIIQTQSQIAELASNTASLLQTFESARQTAVDAAAAAAAAAAIAGDAASVTQYAQSALASANLASAYVSQALRNAEIAQAAADVAQQHQYISMWSAGNFYNSADLVIAPENGLCYRARVNGVSNVSPFTDRTGWQGPVGYDEYLIAEEKQASGVAAGDGVLNGVVTRRLNTLVANQIQGAALGENGVLTLPAGAYEIQAFATCNNVSFSQLRLWDAASVSAIARSVGGIVGAGQHVVQMAYKFVLGETKWLYLQQELRGSSVSNQLGLPALNGQPELYARILIKRGVR